ncbi:hypothetical protein BDZ89DRAFT_1160009 [Hymenopellis radicata]|nr:hypothetical protein BDZ89DRAFT_1160009 [Hymenopellis radicata]
MFSAGLPRDESVVYSDGDKRLFVVFLVLQLCGLATLAVILSTVLLSPTTAKRHVCWINCQFTWLISALSYCLLLGRPIDWTPPHSLCFAQAVLIYSVPTLSACTTTALMIHVFLSIRSILSASGSPSSQRLSIVLATVPYIAALGMAAIPLAFGISDPSLVERRANDGGLYCGIGNGIPGRISSIVVAVIMICCLGLEIAVIVVLRRNWADLRKRRRNHPVLSLSIRVLAFSIFGCLAIALALAFAFTPSRGAIPNLILATLPFIAALIFGTQQDILDVWLSLLCCRKPKRRQLSISQPSTSVSSRIADWEVATPRGYKLPDLYPGIYPDGNESRELELPMQSLRFSTPENHSYK